MLFPSKYGAYDSAAFRGAYAKYDIEQPAAAQRGAAHATTLRAKGRAKVGEVTSLQGAPVNVYTVVAQGVFVDGDGPVVGIGYCMRFHLLNQSGETLGTVFALGKRNIEANDPEREELDYYLFVDRTEEWVVSARPVQVAVAPEDVNEQPARWDNALHGAMEFAAFRSLNLLADQFTRS